jgi:uncharacterized lipoprotein YddW (UPF0748 family)
VSNPQLPLQVFQVVDASREAWFTRETLLAVVLPLERFDRSRLRLSFALVFALILAGSAGCSPSDEAPPETPARLDAPAPGGPESPLQARDGPSQPTDDDAPAVRYRGLWVLCEGSRRTLESRERISQLIAHSDQLGVTDLFVQVYRGGRAWYDSDLADPAPFDEIVRNTGRDPLADLIQQAHEAGIRVHAWVNVLSLSRNRGAPILAQLGPGAVHVDRKGRSILDYPESLELPSSDTDWYRVGTPGIYLDPAAPGVADRLVATFRELVERYPALDGLHLDYIRHPGILPFVPGSRFGVGLDYGYGEASRLRFRRETGLRGPFSQPDRIDPKRIVNANAWDDWRRQKVNELVAGIGEATSVVRPGLLLSAAVIAYDDRAYLSLFQDWHRWVEDGLVDFVVPMIYTLDERLFRYQVESYAGSPIAHRIWAGVGVWLFSKRPERAADQIAIVRSSDLAGDVLFSYDAMAEPEAGARLLEEMTRIAQPIAQPAE